MERHATRIGEMGYKCNILVGISEGKGALRRQGVHRKILK
jgi:hypothetical protein